MMYDEDRDNMDSDKDNNNYYIGIYKHIKITDSLMFLASVSTRVYYNYSFGNFQTVLRFFLFLISLLRYSDIRNIINNTPLHTIPTNVNTNI